MDKNLKAADSDMTDLEIIQTADKRGIDKL
jgi:hypothetical protein